MNYRFFLMMFLSLFISVKGFSDEYDNLSKMTVRGNAKIFQRADQVSITIGVVTENKAANTALLENNQKMTVVIDSVKKLGLTPIQFI